MSTWTPVLGLVLSLGAGATAHGARPKPLEGAARRDAAVDTVVFLPPAALEKFVGQYQLRPDFNLTVWLEGDQLITEVTGQTPIRIHPESDTRFTASVVGAEIDFVRAPHGNVTGLVLHQGGRNVQARKISDSVPPLPTPPDLPTSLLQKYVGVYHFTRDLSIEITRRDDQLYARLPKRSPAPIQAESKIIFSMERPEALLRFSVTSLGKVTGLAIMENGRRNVGLKVK